MIAEQRALRLQRVGAEQRAHAQEQYRPLQGRLDQRKFHRKHGEPPYEKAKRPYWMTSLWSSGCSYTRSRNKAAIFFWYSGCFPSIFVVRCYRCSLCFIGFYVVVRVPYVYRSMFTNIKGAFMGTMSSFRRFGGCTYCIVASFLWISCCCTVAQTNLSILVTIDQPEVRQVLTTAREAEEAARRAVSVRVTPNFAPMRWIHGTGIPRMNPWHGQRGP